MILIITKIRRISFTQWKTFEYKIIICFKAYNSEICQQSRISLVSTRKDIWNKTSLETLLKRIISYNFLRYKIGTLNFVNEDIESEDKLTFTVFYNEKVICLGIFNQHFIDYT